MSRPAQYIYAHNHNGKLQKVKFQSSSTLKGAAFEPDIFRYSFVTSRYTDARALMLESKLKTEEEAYH